jgi:hypothetical protein
VLAGNIKAETGMKPILSGAKTELMRCKETVSPWIID